MVSENVSLQTNLTNESNAKKMHKQRKFCCQIRGQVKVV